MAQAFIEHVNVTVSDNVRAARMLQEAFGWRERWRGEASGGGHTIHVGTSTHYIALYTPPPGARLPERFTKGAPLNHICIQVDDLAETERRVSALGLEPFGHGDYEPGRRFYFFDWDGIEYEVVSYG